MPDDKARWEEILERWDGPVMLEPDIAWLIHEVKRLRAQLDRAMELMTAEDSCPPGCKCCEESMPPDEVCVGQQKTYVLKGKHT